jgi:BclB C-terminal domain-containing protein
MSAFFSLTVALALVGSTVTLTAQLYESTTPDNVFTPVPGAIVTLAPALTGVVAIGTIATGNVTGLNIPVTQGTRLMFVISAELTAGLPVAAIIVGDVSGGVTIQ